MTSGHARVQSTSPGHDEHREGSQIALPEDVCHDVYGSADGYDSSRSNLSQVSLESDGIFSDGYSLQMAKVTGSVDDGYAIALTVPV